MVIDFKAAEQKKPLLVKSIGKKKEMFDPLTSKDMDPEKVKREFEVSTQALDDQGQLFMEVDNIVSAKWFWLHLVTPGFVLEIKYPNGGKAPKPNQPKVIIHKSQARIVADVDHCQYSFKLAEMADSNLYQTIEDPKTLVMELLEYVWLREEKKAGVTVS